MYEQSIGQEESHSNLNLFTAPPLRAGPGYELHRGVGYYKIHTELKTWHEARQICAQEGAHLAIVNSEEESKVLQSLFTPVAAKLKVAWAFIGFHDLYNEGRYLTVFGTKSPSQNNLIIHRCLDTSIYLIFLSLVICVD
jgi:hypothetical protein